MKAINSVALTPISALPKRTTKPFSIPNISHLKTPNFTNSDSISRTLKGSIVLFSSLLTSQLAKALTYDEALQQSIGTDFQSNELLDNAINFAAENPIIIGGGLAIAAVPLIVSQLFSKPKAWGIETAKNAYAKLGDDSNAQLLDIRGLADVKEGGNPDIRGIKKKVVGIVYKGGDKLGFLEKLALKFKEPGNTTLYILDKFDGNSELVAELVTANGFKAAYAIKDGAEGSRGWKNSGLPWVLPKKALSLDLRNLTDSFGEVSDAVPVILGVAVAVGLGLLAFTEVEIILQVLGTAALIQLVTKKLLFAEDRKLTIQQIEEVLSTKVAPKELVGDIQQIGKALLPTVVSKALPAPAIVETAPEPTPEVNSVAKAEVQEESLPVFTTSSLSPYPNYPDYKPPSSPIPSQP